LELKSGKRKRKTKEEKNNGGETEWREKMEERMNGGGKEWRREKMAEGKEEEV